MNPSRVQLQRYAIHGYARHTHPKVLIDHVQGSHYCSINQTCQLRYDANKEKLAACLLKKSHATHSNTPPPVNKYLVSVAASAAMDGAAPESGRDDPLREKRYSQGTPRTGLPAPIILATQNRTEQGTPCTYRPSYYCAPANQLSCSRNATTSPTIIKLGLCTANSLTC